MSLIGKIKEAQLQARKDRKETESALLTTLLSEASLPGKNSGNRESTDDEVVAVVKKFIKNTDETLEALKFLSDGRVAKAIHEKKILESFLPKQLTEDELRAIISAELNKDGPKQMGRIMSALKTSYAGLYDGAVASRIAKELLG